MNNVTNGSELRDEQLDAVVGGSGGGSESESGPSLWDILGPAITQTVNAGKSPAYGEITVF